MLSNSHARHDGPGASVAFLRFRALGRAKWKSPVSPRKQLGGRRDAGPQLSRSREKHLPKGCFTACIRAFGKRPACPITSGVPGLVMAAAPRRARPARQSRYSGPPAEERCRGYTAGLHRGERRDHAAGRAQAGGLAAEDRWQWLRLLTNVSNFKGKEGTVNQPPHGFAGSSPASPTTKQHSEIQGDFELLIVERVRAVRPLPG